MWHPALSRAIQPLTSDVLRVLFFLTYFTFSDWPCFEVKDEEDLLLEKTVKGTKPVEAKERVNDSESCESEELLEGREGGTKSQFPA